MVGWHHQLNGHEFEQTQGDSEGQGSLASCSPWGHKESDTTEGLHNKEMKPINPKVNQPFIGRIEVETLILWLPEGKSQLIGEDADAGKD